MLMILGFAVAQVIIFGATILVLKRLIFQDTASAINRINKLDALNRQKERTLAEKLDQAEKFFEKRKKEMEEKEELWKQEAQRAAHQLQEDILKKAKEEAEEVIRKAQAAKDHMRTEVLIEAEGKVIDFCGEVLHKVLAQTVRASLDDELIKEFISEIQKADLARVGHDIHEVEIVSCRPIGDQHRDQIKHVLQEKLSREMQVKTREDHAVLGGVVLRLGSLVIDGSLSERIKESAEKMKDELSWRHHG